MRYPVSFLAYLAPADFAGWGLQYRLLHCSVPGKPRRAGTALEEEWKKDKSAATPQAPGEGHADKHQKMVCRNQGRSGQDSWESTFLPGRSRETRSSASKELWKGGGQHGKTPTNHLGSKGFRPSSKQDCSHHIPRREDLPRQPRSWGEREMGQTDTQPLGAQLSLPSTGEHREAKSHPQQCSRPGQEEK